MDDYEIEKLISSSAQTVPDSLWNRIQYDVAKDIAAELIANLNSQMEPKKQESLDRVNSIIQNQSLQIQIRKGA